jgi:hypothetical protein
MNITYTIARYELINDNTFLVAFNVKSESNSSFYIESPLTLSETSGKTATEICQLAYDKIKTKIEEILNRLQQQKDCKVGFQFIPE